MEAPITTEEIEAAVFSFVFNKMPGLDGSPLSGIFTIKKFYKVLEIFLDSKEGIKNMYTVNHFASSV